MAQFFFAGGVYRTGLRGPGGGDPKPSLSGHLGVGGGVRVPVWSSQALHEMLAVEDDPQTAVSLLRPGAQGFRSVLRLELGLWFELKVCRWNRNTPSPQHRWKSLRPGAEVFCCFSFLSPGRFSARHGKLGGRRCHPRS